MDNERTLLYLMSRYGLYNLIMKLNSEDLGMEGFYRRISIDNIFRDEFATSRTVKGFSVIVIMISIWLI